MLVENLPAGGALWAAQHGIPYGITITDILIADLWSLQTEQRHPMMPDFEERAKKAANESMVAKLVAQRERERQRKEALAREAANQSPSE